MIKVLTKKESKKGPVKAATKLREAFCKITTDSKAC